MPTTCGHRDSKGAYCRWGSQGAKYYYTPGDDASKEAARKKANAQGAAAHAGGYEGSEKSIEIVEEKKEEKPKVPNPDKPGEEDEPGSEDNEEEELRKKSISIPKSFEEIKENCYIVHKGKIAKIVKVLEK